MYTQLFATLRCVLEVTEAIVGIESCLEILFIKEGNSVVLFFLTVFIFPVGFTIWLDPCLFLSLHIWHLENLDG